MFNASAEQIGNAARMRDHLSGKDRKALNYVVHSQHPDPRYGPNPFAGNPRYDPKVTEFLKDLATSCQPRTSSSLKSCTISRTCFGESAANRKIRPRQQMTYSRS